MKKNSFSTQFLFFLPALLVVLAVAFLAGGCGPVKKESSSPVPAPAVAGLNPRALEIEKALLAQLEPLPQLNTGDKIGALVITLANPFWVGMKESYEQAAKELGVQVEVMAAPTEGDKKSQLETLEAMAAKDYKALIISPIEPFNLVPGVVKASQKGIKIVNLGPPVNKDEVVRNGGSIDARITVNYEDQGRLAAEYIVQKLGQAGGKVAIIQGIPGAGQSEGRTKGALAVFEKHSNVQVVSVQPGNWDRNTAYNVATNIIQAHPDLKAVFCCNDVMALAASSALEAAGKRQGVIIYGVDFIPEAYEAIKAGKMDGTVAYSARVYGKAAVLLAMKLVQGHNVPQEVYSPLVAVTRENIDEFAGWQ